MSIEFEFSDDFKSSNSVTDEQLSAVTSHIKDQLADHEKLLNIAAQKNSQNIIVGAAKKTMDITGVPMNDGEHHGDYLARVGELYLEREKKELSAAKKIYEDKVSSFKGEDELKSLQEKVSSYKQKEAQYDEVISARYKDKFESVSKEYSDLLKRQAYTSVMPSFSEGVNKYEADYKVKEVKAEIENTYDIKEVDGVWLAIDKNNEYKQKPLSELITNHPTIKSLTEGKKQKGFKTTNGESVSVNGLSLEKGMETKDVHAKIRSHLISKLGSNTHPSYGAEFKKMTEDYYNK